MCVFSALYCCVGEAQGKGGTDNALWNRVQSRLHGKMVEAITLSGCFFRQGKEENLGWRRILWRGPKQMLALLLELHNI